MKRVHIVGSLIGVVGLLVLALEISIIMGYFEDLVKHNTTDAVASISKIQQEHSPPELVSTKSKEWENIYAYIKKRNNKVYPKFAAEITDYVLHFSEKYNVKWPIIVSVMAVESNFNYSAVSNKNAVGLMQIVHKIWKDDEDYDDIIEEEDDLFDPERNIEAGVLILSKLKEKHKEPRKYLNAYYGGTGYYEKISVVFSGLMFTTEYQ
jgi:soluble lytic murein transglycosylase-like protein